MCIYILSGSGAYIKLGREGIGEDDVIRLGRGGEDDWETEDTLPLELYLSSLSQQYNVSIGVEDFTQAQDELTSRRGGHRASVCQVCLKMLQERGALSGGQRDYDKVEVAMKVVEKMPLDALPNWYTALAQKTQEKLSALGAQC